MVNEINDRLLQTPIARFLTKLDLFLKPEEDDILDFNWINRACNLKHLKIMTYCSSEIIKIIGKVCEASNQLESIIFEGGNIWDEYFGNVEHVLRKNVKTLRHFHLPLYKCSEVEGSLITQCRKLESLSIRCDNIPVAKFNAIPDEKNLKEVALHFLYNNADKDVAAFLRHPKLSQLTSLQISSYTENKITSDVVKCIDAMKFLTYVRLDDPFVQLSTCCCRSEGGLDNIRGRPTRDNFPTIFDLIHGNIPIGDGNHVLCSECYQMTVLKRV